MKLLRIAACVGLLTLALFLPMAFSNDPKPHAAKPTAPAKTAPKPNFDVKLFRLQRADPVAVQSAMGELFGPWNETKIETIPHQPPPVAPIQSGGLGGGIGGIAGLGGGIGGINLGGPPGVPLWRSAVSQRLQALIVRGSPRYLEMTADLVAVLDRPQGATVPKLKIIRAFALKHADAESVVQIIADLSFDDVRMSIANNKLLLLIGPEAHLKTITELVKELDVKAKPEPKPDKE